MNTNLLPCPHCGGQPVFSGWRERDDRRYVQMKLECCAEYSADISYPRFDSMTSAQISAELQADLTEQWNKRYVEEIDEDAHVTGESPAARTGSWLSNAGAWLSSTQAVMPDGPLRADAEARKE